MQTPHYNISVKTLVESTRRRGDLHVRVSEPTDAREGIRAQKHAQQGRGDTYRREVALTHRFEGRGLVLDVAGRADGCILEPPLIEVEEFKATRADPSVFANSQASVHWAQLETYGAALGASVEGCQDVKLCLIYVHPDDLTQHREERIVSLAELTGRLASTCDEFAAQLAHMLTHRKARDEGLRELEFPFGEFRPVQRRLANAAYRAFRDQQHLLAEAPTGGGKTLGCVFPGLKALAEGHLDRFVVLSSRTTGQHAVEEAVDLCMAGSAALRPITITAKDKVCLSEEVNCDPQVCPYAAGYYDRRDDAVRALLDSGLRLDAQRIGDVAQQNEVCPFELSLDVAQWCDVIIGDYNYVFDPLVRLMRLRGPVGDRTAVLIDEAHQLGDRVRAMLSATVSRAEIKAAASAAPDLMHRRIKALDRCLLDLRRETLGRTPVKEERFEAEIALPARLTRAIDRLLDAVGSMTADQQANTDLRALLWAVSRYRRALDWLPEAARTVMLRGGGREIDVEIRAIDPAPHIAATLEDYHASLRFSATLTPLALTNRQHGLADQPVLRLPSTFDPAQLGVFAVPDVSTLYRDRQRSLDALVDAVERCVAAREGNYLIVFPSFAYLEDAAARFEQRHGHREVLRQQPHMTDPERNTFLDAFRRAVRPGNEADESHLGFVVMGGIFAESVDLPGDSLIGMIIVGIGLPPPNLERQCIARAFEHEGRAVAFDQPAMTRVVQAAGRLLRTETDRAALCLIDPRYLDDRYGVYFPPLWNVQVTASIALDSALQDFWQQTG